MFESSWIAGLTGGLFIGSAGAILLLGNGRIMGASGIVGSLIDGTSRRETLERLTFVTGLVAAPAFIARFGEVPATHATESVGMLVFAGLLVGVGTRIGGGCTSGHGVCGLSRLSLRSLVATVTFMAAGALAVWLLRSLV